MIKENIFLKKERYFLFSGFSEEKDLFFKKILERKNLLKMIFKKKVLFLKTTFENGIKLFEKSFSFGKANYRDLFYPSY